MSSCRTVQDLVMFVANSTKNASDKSSRQSNTRVKSVKRDNLLAAKPRYFLLINALKMISSRE